MLPSTAPCKRLSLHRSRPALTSRLILPFGSAMRSAGFPFTTLSSHNSAAVLGNAVKFARPSGGLRGKLIVSFAPRYRGAPVARYDPVEEIDREDSATVVGRRSDPRHKTRRIRSFILFHSILHGRQPPQEYEIELVRGSSRWMTRHRGRWISAVSLAGNGPGRHTPHKQVPSTRPRATYHSPFPPTVHTFVPPFASLVLFSSRSSRHGLVFGRCFLSVPG